MHAHRGRSVGSVGCRRLSHPSDLCVPRRLITRCPRKLIVEPNKGRFSQMIYLGKATPYDRKGGKDHADCSLCGAFACRDSATLVSRDAERTCTRGSAGDRQRHRDDRSGTCPRHRTSRPGDCPGVCQRRERRGTSDRWRCQRCWYRRHKNWQRRLVHRNAWLRLLDLA